MDCATLATGQFMNRQLVLVPQGAEYTAVKRGLRRHALAGCQVIPLRVGRAAIATPELVQVLANPVNRPAMAVVLGVCGGLAPGMAVGQVVVYDTCQDETGAVYALDAQLRERLGNRWRSVQAMTTEQVICQAQAKQALAKRWGVQVVDMEGIPLVQQLQGLGIPVAMVRVISDGGDRDLPDLSRAFDPEGNLQPWFLLAAMLRQPLAAVHLVQGSLRALSVLAAIAPEVLQCLSDPSPAPLP